MRGTGVHAVMGIGGAPEGVITAAAMRCLGGEIQARLRGHRRRAARAPRASSATTTSTAIYAPKTWRPGEQILFACTGVTDGELLHGVRFFGGGYRTHDALHVALAARSIRFVDTIHREDAHDCRSTDRAP